MTSTSYGSSAGLELVISENFMTITLETIV